MEPIQPEQSETPALAKVRKAINDGIAALVTARAAYAEKLASITRYAEAVDAVTAFYTPHQGGPTEPPPLPKAPVASVAETAEQLRRTRLELLREELALRVKIENAWFPSRLMHREHLRTGAELALDKAETAARLKLAAAGFEDPAPAMVNQHPDVSRAAEEAQAAYELSREGDSGRLNRDAIAHSR